MERKADKDIKTELHLLEYHRTRLEFLHFFRIRKQQTSMVPVVLKKFSDPCKPDGYNDKPITDDLISDVYLAFSNQTRSSESQEYLRTLGGQ
jgi:hypothetical protein